jgi:methyl-accepting chemotaxis protein
MAFNTGGYNPYNTFQVSYGGYNPSTSAYNMPVNPGYSPAYRPTTGYPSSGRYQQPSSYTPYNQGAYNRFQSPNYSYGNQNRYGYGPSTGYNRYSLNNRYSPIRPSYYEESPQIIYMQQPAPPPKKSVWDWKKFAMTAGAMATGLGVFFLMAKNVAKIEINHMIKNELPDTLSKLANQFVKDEQLRKTVKDWANDVASDVLKRQTPALKQTARETVNELIGEQAKKAKGILKEILETAGENPDQIMNPEQVKLKLKELATLVKKVPELAEQTQQMMAKLSTVVDKAPGMVEQAQQMMTKLSTVVDKAPGMTEQAQQMMTKMTPVVDQAPGFAEQAKVLLQRLDQVLNEVQNSRSYKLFTWTNGTTK